MNELNAEQRAVVESAADKILCIAGPGSGKTHTLCSRIARLSSLGVEPRRMVIITFTNAAANELKKRFTDAAGVKDPNVLKFGYLGTLHGFIFRLLAKHGALVGLPSGLSVADDDQKAGMVESIIEEMGFKGVSAKKVVPLLRQPDLIDGLPGSKAREELVATAYHHALRAGGLMDFDSMLHLGLKLIKRLAPPCDDGSAWPWTHLFVDEFQDSADEDAAIYEAMPCQSKFLVGDPDQAVYAFRGGNVDNILRLTGDERWTTFKLQTNHRCKHKICEAAQRLIEHNVVRFPKATVAGESGGAVHAERFKTPGEELGFIFSDVRGAADSPAGAKSYGESAVLCRTNRLAGEVADFFKKLGVPVATKKPVVVPPDWRSAKLLLTVVANPWNDFAVHQLLVATEGKAKADAIKLKAAAAMDSINSYLGGHYMMTLDSALLAESISMESRQRIRDAAAKLSAAGEWTIPDLIFFLNSGEEHQDEIGEGVTVTTMHSAKGREWRTVFICAAEDGVVPGERKDVDVAEERRLFYVAMTRAEQRLVVTHCEARPAAFGQFVMRPAAPSRFIKEAGLE